MDIIMADQYERLIQVLNKPDWWMFGVTLVNAFAIIGLTLYLGLKQKKIQEVQKQIQREQLRIECMRGLREIYNYMTEFRSLTGQFCNQVFRILYDIINEQPEKDAIRQVAGLQEQIKRSAAALNLLRADLIARKETSAYIDKFDALYKYMDQATMFLKNTLYQIYGAHAINQMEESEKRDFIRFILPTVQKIDPRYRNNNQTFPDDLQEQDVVEMIAIIKRYIRAKVNVMWQFSVWSIDTLENIDSIISPFNPVAANAITETLRNVINLHTDLFRGKRIMEVVEEEIRRA